MKRTLIAVAALIGLASAANAATLTVVADAATYSPGDTITLTVTGDSQGASSTGIFGRLLFDNAAAVNTAGGTPTQTTLLALGSIPWLVGVTGCDSSACNMFNQVGAFGATPAPASNLLVATVSLIAGPGLGVVNAAWETNAGTGFALDFFGLSAAAGTSFEVVPEPTTAALLGLGLFGLAVAGRRRA
jgi:hypothetical protein